MGSIPLYILIFKSILYLYDRIYCIVIYFFDKYNRILSIECSKMCKKHNSYLHPQIKITAR